MVDLNYICEKLGVAVEYLACLDKPLRQRLYQAFGSFHVLNPMMMPTKEMREDLESIRNRFYRIPKEEADNPLIASLKMITDNEAYRLAYDIYQVSERVHIARAPEEGDDW